MRCEATLTNDYLRIGGSADRDKQCRRGASYQVGREALCSEHASMACLQMAKEAGTVKRLTRRKSEKEYRPGAAE